VKEFPHMSNIPVTLVIAPSIPTSERIALEAHVKEAVLDPDYAVILNYEATMEEFVIPEGHKVLIQAPGVPVSEIQDLRKRFDVVRAAEKPEDRVLVVNYEIRVDVISPEEITRHGDVFPTDMDESFLG
jgi:hypothetical protein